MWSCMCSFPFDWIQHSNFISHYIPLSAAWGQTASLGCGFLWTTCETEHHSPKRSCVAPRRQLPEQHRQPPVRTGSNGTYSRPCAVSCVSFLTDEMDCFPAPPEPHSADCTQRRWYCFIVPRFLQKMNDESMNERINSTTNFWWFMITEFGIIPTTIAECFMFSPQNRYYFAVDPVIISTYSL